MNSEGEKIVAKHLISEKQKIINFLQIISRKFHRLSRSDGGKPSRPSHSIRRFDKTRISFQKYQGGLVLIMVLGFKKRREKREVPSHNFCLNRLSDSLESGTEEVPNIYPTAENVLSFLLYKWREYRLYNMDPYPLLFWLEKQPPAIFFSLYLSSKKNRERITWEREEEERDRENSRRRAAN